MEEKMKIGLLGAGGTLKIKDGYLNFQHPYGKTFKVRVADIETVVIDVVGMGQGELRLIGHGTDLAKTKMPAIWANKCQEWILSKINNI